MICELIEIGLAGVTQVGHSKNGISTGYTMLY